MLDTAKLTRVSWAEPIGIAMDLLPVATTQRFHFRDPVFSGLTEHVDTADGRSYRSAAHCCYPWHINGPADRRLTTIVIPERPRGDWWDVYTVVHEMGHVLDWMTGFSHVCKPVSDYARTNDMEAFACAFGSWLVPGWHGTGVGKDDRMMFESL